MACFLMLKKSLNVLVSTGNFQKPGGLGLIKPGFQAAIVAGQQAFAAQGDQWDKKERAPLGPFLQVVRVAAQAAAAGVQTGPQPLNYCFPTN